jgi:[ribosomal protein S5]-alanine N-acetyltransferase
MILATGRLRLRPVENGDVELLYSLSPARWGQGLITEAATAILEYAFKTPSLPRVVAEVDEGNAASVRTALRLGMTREPTSRSPSKPVHRFVLSAPAKPEE